MANGVSKVVQIGNSLGFTVPKALLEQLNLRKGDEVVVTRVGHDLVISAYDEAMLKDLQTVRDVAGRYRNTLRSLAE